MSFTYETSHIEFSLYSCLRDVDKMHKKAGEKMGGHPRRLL